MPDLDFRIVGAEAVKFAASPQIALKLQVTNSNPAETIHSVALRCQIQIEVTRRRYTAEDQQKLRDLFGEPERWSQTLRNLLWTHVNVNVPPFRDSTMCGSSRCHARLTSMLAPPSIFTVSAMGMFRCA